MSYQYIDLVITTPEIKVPRESRFVFRNSENKKEVLKFMNKIEKYLESRAKIGVEKRSEVLFLVRMHVESDTYYPFVVGRVKKTAKSDLGEQLKHPNQYTKRSSR